MTDLNFVTHNVPPRLSQQEAQAAIMEAAKGADVLCLQEASSWHDIINDLGGKAWIPPFPGPGSTPIVVLSKRLDVREIGASRVYPEGQEIEPGSGPAKAHADWVVWLVADDRESGYSLGVINAHPISQPRNGPRREALHAETIEHVQLLAEDLHATFCFNASAVVALGDWNGQPTDDRMRLLRKGHDWSCDTLDSPTIGQGSYDDAYRYDPDEILQFVSQSTFKTASDHKGARVTYRIIKEND